MQGQTGTVTVMGMIGMMAAVMGIETALKPGISTVVDVVIDMIDICLQVTVTAFLKIGMVHPTATVTVTLRMVMARIVAMRETVDLAVAAAVTGTTVVDLLAMKEVVAATERGLGPMIARPEVAGVRLRMRTAILDIY